MATSLQPLESYRWKHRIILYTSDAQAMRQFNQAVEERKEAIIDRDLYFVNLGAPNNTELNRHLTLSAPAIDELRAILRTQPKVNELILVGKDGGIKERIDRIDLQFLFDAIDQMPMRRAEMRSQ